MLKIFLKGLITGLILQLAVGPVFIFITNISFQNGLINGLSAVTAVTIADYIYITLALIGVGKILDNKKIKKVFTIISSIILIIFGIVLIKNSVNLIENSSTTEIINFSFLQSFVSAFILTISSPLTILFWTTVFTAKTAEYSLNKKELTTFGIAAGLATFLFLSSSIIILSFVGLIISRDTIQILNITVGFSLIGYSIKGFLKIYPSI